MRPPLIPQSVAIEDSEPMKTKILKSCFNHLVEYREPKTGRIVVSLFMCLPSRKEFPEYFDIVDRPISMYEIRKRIENNLYQCEDDCIADFKLMFNNCRFFNEDFSQIFHDACLLEAMLLKKYEILLREHGVGGGMYNATSRHLGRNNINNSNTNHQAPVVSTPTRGVANNNNYNSQHSDARTPDRSSPAVTTNNSYKTKSDRLSTSKKRAKNALKDGNQNHYQQQQQQPPQQQQSQQKQQNDHRQYHNQISHSNQSITNGISSDIDSNSNSNNYFAGNGAGGSTEDSSFIISHNFHNETSIDSNSNLSMGLDSSLPLPADNPNPKPKRLKRDPNAPKKRLLTGYIIYAAEVRKEYVDKHPNQDFGFVSRLIGHDWKSLSQDARKAYEQRAMAHNKKLQEKILRDSMIAAQTGQPYPMTNGTSTPKMTKRKLAKLAREQARMQKSSTPYLNKQDNSSFVTPIRQQDGSRPSHLGSQTATRSSSEYYSSRVAQQANLGQQIYGKAMTTETATQTAPIRFVEPPAKRQSAYNENFRRYIESLEVPNLDLLAEETAAPPFERPPEPPTKWLGGGIGRHGSEEAALWALRDFMLQDSSTMRWNMQPYLSADLQSPSYSTN